jgi:hypothetical protein
MKIRPVRAELFREERTGQANMTKKIVASRNFAKALKNICQCLQITSLW